MEENDPFATNQPPETPVTPPRDELPPSPLGDAPTAPMARPQELASAGKRLLARIVDFFVLIIPIIIVAIIFNQSQFLLTLAALIISGTYEVMMISSRGQTVGKMALGIKVVDETTGQIPEVQAAAFRWGLPQAFGVIPVIGGLISLVIYLSILWRDRNQGFHDTVAKTVVVEA